MEAPAWPALVKNSNCLFSGKYETIALSGRDNYLWNRTIDYIGNGGEESIQAAERAR